MSASTTTLSSLAVLAIGAAATRIFDVEDPLTLIGFSVPGGLGAGLFYISSDPEYKVRSWSRLGFFAALGFTVTALCGGAIVQYLYGRYGMSPTFTTLLGVMTGVGVVTVPAIAVLGGLLRLAGSKQFLAVLARGALGRLASWLPPVATPPADPPADPAHPPTPGAAE